VKNHNYFEIYRGIKSNLIYSSNPDIKPPHLSVVIPTYKRPDVFREAVQSVLEQTYLEDVDLIIVDNEESEVPTETEAFVKTIKSIPVRYYRNEKNIGAIGNWNRCFELADGEWVLMLHADDMLLPNCLERIKDIVNSDLHFAALYVNRRGINEGGYNKEPNKKMSLKGKVYRRIFKPKNIHRVEIADYLLGLSLAAPTGFLVKKSVILNIGGYNVLPPDDSTSKINMRSTDTELAIKLAKMSMLWFYDECLVLKREGWNNLSADKKVTIAVVESHYALFADVFATQRILVKRFLISMRMIDIMKWAHADKGDISFTIPSRYYSKLYSHLYSFYKRIYKLLIINFR
jgi:glycosyltransferase involved in cell wall biosynthesis